MPVSSPAPPSRYAKAKYGSFLRAAFRIVGIVGNRRYRSALRPRGGIIAFGGTEVTSGMTSGADPNCNSGMMAQPASAAKEGPSERAHGALGRDTSHRAIKTASAD